jgi:hypothetical protein
MARAYPSILQQFKGNSNFKKVFGRRSPISSAKQPPTLQNSVGAPESSPNKGSRRNHGTRLYTEKQMRKERGGFVEETA